MYTQVRWQQRFQNFEKAYTLLKNIASIKTPSEGEKLGLIQAFEICFELAWKLMKDYLEEAGHIVKSPRDVLKQALQDDIIQDGRTWLEALEKRNETVHLYDEKIALILEKKISLEYMVLFHALYQFFQNELNKK